jgi:GT2 family glycosyltransferase
VRELIVLAVPTYRRYDLCLRMLRSAAAGTLTPERVLIIDNGGTFREYARERAPICPPWIDLVEPGRNLGVAASWNYALRWANGTPALIVNDDVVLDLHTVEAFADASRRDQPQVIQAVPTPTWSCFLQNQNMFQLVGDFDEGFYPAYFEDGDYRWRMRCLGHDVDLIDAGAIRHDASSTLASYSPAEREDHERTYRANALRYAQKWGGPPGLEKFLVARPT